jgi:hypothetical protein
MRLSGIAVLSWTADFIIWSFLFPAITGLMYGLRICRGAKGPPGKRLSVPTQTTWCRVLKEFCQLVENKNVGTAVAGIALRFPPRRCPRIIAIQRRTDPCVFARVQRRRAPVLETKQGCSQLFPLSHLSCGERLTQIPQFVIHLGGFANRAADFFTQNCPIPRAQSG